MKPTRINQPVTNVPATYIILMTACIDPSNGSVPLYRKDPAIRLQDYLDGLRFWLNLADKRLDKIVFIENSGYPLDALQAPVRTSNPLRKEVEFISLNCNTYPAGLSYGYAELQMIEEAFIQSKLLNECSHFIKATGRLTFPTITHLLNRLPQDYMFAIDCRNNSLFLRNPQLGVMAQLMIFSTSFYRQYLLHAKEELSQELPHIETLLYNKLLHFKGQRGAMLRWPVNVAPVGYPATLPCRYDVPRSRIVNIIRSVCRIVLPNWWV